MYDQSAGAFGILVLTLLQILFKNLCTSGGNLSRSMILFKLRQTYIETVKYVPEMEFLKSHSEDTLLIYRLSFKIEFQECMCFLIIFNFKSF